MISQSVLFQYLVFVYGGLHPSASMAAYLTDFCKVLIVVINGPALWKILLELVRHGNVELKLIDDRSNRFALLVDVVLRFGRCLRSYCGRCHAVPDPADLLLGSLAFEVVPDRGESASWVKQGEAVFIWKILLPQDKLPPKAVICTKLLNCQTTGLPNRPCPSTTATNSSASPVATPS